MDFQGYPVRSAFSINRADLQRGLNEPESAAKRGMNDMLTTNRTPKAIKAPQSDGVACPKCGKSHRGGTICGFDKSLSPFEKALAEIVKGGTNRLPPGAAESAGGRYTFGGTGVPVKDPKHSGPGKKEGGGGKKKTSSQPEPATTTGSRATPSPTGGESSSAGEAAPFDPWSTPQKGDKVHPSDPSENKASREAENATVDAWHKEYESVKNDPENADMSPDHLEEMARDQARGAGDRAAEAAYSRHDGEGGGQPPPPPEGDMQSKMEALRDASRKKSPLGSATGAGKVGAAQEGKELAGAEKIDPKYEHAQLVAESKEKEPEKFVGGPQQSRKERSAGAETQSAETAQRAGRGALEPKDEYEASELGQATAVQEQARQAALAGGANEFDADQAANQAWQDNFHAHQEAREQGIPVAQIAGQESQLAQAYRAKQGGATTGPSGTQVMQGPPTGPSGTQVMQGPPTGPSGTQVMQSPPPGMTPPPRENYYPGIPVPPEASPATPEAAPATPGDGTPPTRPARPTRQQISWPGIGFSQMYGAGQSIGSAEGTPGGVVSPAAGLAAQQVHHLLNPNIRREAAPSMAGSGRVAGTGAGAISPGVKPSQSALKQPAMKSLIAWKQKYEQRI